MIDTNNQLSDEEQKQEEPEWHPVVSSNIAAWRYFKDTKTLEVEFANSDDLYSYDDVPEDVAEGLGKAGSVGQYFRAQIRNRYKFYKG